MAMDGSDTWKRYDPLTKDAVVSFKKFHPDVDVHIINNDNVHDYIDFFKNSLNIDVEIYDHPGIFKFMMGALLMKSYEYSKLIMLGVDTITCARLDEFILDKTPILATLNYPCVESTEYWKTPTIQYKINETDTKVYYDVGNINADVVCFNSVDALEKVINLSITHFTHFAEQGALNEMAWVDKTVPVKIVDFPYAISNVVYNARSKGVIGTDMIKNGVLTKCGSDDGKPATTTMFHVHDSKLYTHDNKQVKVFHYVEGLGGRDIQSFNAVVNDFRTWFNTATIEYFKSCGCTLFDNKLTV